MSKVLIIDKSIFHGTKVDTLKKLAKNHQLILPYIMYVECVISESETRGASKDPLKLVSKFLDVVKSGAYAGKSPAGILEEEKAKNAAISSIIDEKETELMRKGTIDKNIDIKKISSDNQKALEPTIRFVQKWAEELHKNICKKRLQKKFVEEAQEDLVKRLKKMLFCVDKQKKDIIKKFLSDEGCYFKTDRWSWQLLRLCLTWGIELASKRNQSGPSFENRDISNDIYDMYYVACLFKADGLITGDERLVKPLAKTAFPEKNIFSAAVDVSDKL